MIGLVKNKDGFEFGLYVGENKHEILNELAKDAGYSNFSEILETTETERCDFIVEDVRDSEYMEICENIGTEISHKLNSYNQCLACIAGLEIALIYRKTGQIVSGGNILQTFGEQFSTIDLYDVVESLESGKFYQKLAYLTMYTLEGRLSGASIMAEEISAEINFRQERI